MWFRPPQRADRLPAAAGARSRTRFAFARRVARSLLPLSALCSFLAVSCINNEERPDAYLKLEAGADIMTYQRVAIRMSDTLGRNPVTLFNDSVSSMGRLDRLNAGSYRGGKVRISIEGYRASVLVYREIRQYDGASQKVLSVEVARGDSLAVIPVVPVAPVTPGIPTGTDTGITIKPVRHAPGFAAFPPDTLVTIKDSVPLPSEATDADGDLAGYAWDCNGDGRPEDSAALAGYRAAIRFSRTYPDSGTRLCVLKIWDKEGQSAERRVRIQVVLDPPVAKAGHDTVVVAGTAINLHANGEDGYGPVVSREWKLGSSEYKPMTQGEWSTQAPMTPGELVCILRLTDMDGLTGYDTMVVTVIYSPDNTLSDLKSNLGTVSPAFRKDIRDYAVALAPADSVLALYPTASDSRARMEVAGMDLSTPDPRALPIKAGDNIFTIRVTAQDGSTLQYTVTVRR
jgi:cadherin-like protein